MARESHQSVHPNYERSSSETSQKIRVMEEDNEDG